MSCEIHPMPSAPSVLFIAMLIADTKGMTAERLGFTTNIQPKSKKTIGWG